MILYLIMHHIFISYKHPYMTKLYKDVYTHTSHTIQKNKIKWKLLLKQTKTLEK